MLDVVSKSSVRSLPITWQRITYACGGFAPKYRLNPPSWSLTSNVGATNCGKLYEYIAGVEYLPSVLRAYKYTVPFRFVSGKLAEVPFTFASSALVSLPGSLSVRSSQQSTSAFNTSFHDAVAWSLNDTAKFLCMSGTSSIALTTTSTTWAVSERLPNLSTATALTSYSSPGPKALIITWLLLLPAYCQS